MAEWLAHPNEFGVHPSRVKLRRTARVSLFDASKTRVHLLDYEMPDGTKGLGFVGPFVWSFCEPDLLSADENDILKAYIGLVFVLAGRESGALTTDFEPDTEREEAFVSTWTSEGYSDVRIHERYRVGELEIYEFTAVLDGKKFRGAGNGSYTIGYQTTCLCSISHRSMSSLER